MSTVAVAVGQKVTDGEELASLDTAALSSAVATDQSQISTEQTKLAADEASEAAGTTDTTTTTTTTPGSSPSGSTDAAITAAQGTLTSDQHKQDTDSAQAKSDLTQATATCGSSSGSTCTSELQLVLTDQQTVAQDEQTVAQDETDLAKLLNSSAESSQEKSSTGDAAAGTGSDSGGSGSSVSNGDGSSAAATPYEIAADQATLDADDVQLSEAQASLDEGNLTSPLNGVVASVEITAGENVAANSSSAQIMVIGPQSFEVSTTVAVGDVSEVKVGAPATVALDGEQGDLTGTVSQVGPAPVGSSSTDYPVVVSLPSDAQGLFDGASANVGIVVGGASDVVTVPTSALHLLGRTAYVDELRAGKLQDVPVTLGAMGGDRTQVSSGVKAGDVVVLANLSEPVPTNTTTGFGSFAGNAALTGTGLGGGTFSRRSPG